ncbi:LuxR C-terminal-related transcriptional regulator [Halomonas profundus]|nr:LuxR C-terminal-related transcriptional regulator [Halomonas profundus]
MAKVYSKTKTLDPYNTQLLLGHLSNCLRGGSETSITKAIQWLQSLADCDKAIAAQLCQPQKLPQVRQFINLGYPLEWINLYKREQFQKHDPVVMHGIRSSRIFSWSDSFDSRECNKTLLDASISHGLDNGFACSFISPDHSQVTFLSLSKPSRKLDAPLEFAIDSLIPALHFAFSMSPPVTMTKLTAREMEVISWSKEGKTVWEISVILNLSQATIKFHFKNIYKKLEVSNRAQAISVAIAAGLITP